MDGPVEATIASIRHEISSCERQLVHLRQKLANAEARAAKTAAATQSPVLENSSQPNGGLPAEWQAELSAVLEQPQPQKKKWPLNADDYKRYGRQLIMPEIGLQGQRRLRDTAVLIVGMGGLGCPAAAYLAGAGIGTLGLVDGDSVEESNLHRQILHATSRVGMSKVDSAMILNPTVKYNPHKTQLAPSNAIGIFSNYDLVLDCTDTPASRYLISDTCVLLGKPLVSASALRTDGQLTIFNNPPLPPGDLMGGPCYRCIFPRPPPAESVVSCGEGGVLGPVVGVMGVLQALEAIKLIAADTPMDIDRPTPNGSNSAPKKPNKASLLIFSAYGNPQFRSFGLRSRKPRCAACSAEATVTREALSSGSMDYVQFCGASSPVNALSPDERISAREYHQAANSESNGHVLVDVRDKIQFELAHLDGSINIPFSDIERLNVQAPSAANTPVTPESSASTPSAQEETQPDWVKQLQQTPSDQPIIVTCRLGNDSQIAVKKMKALGLDKGGSRAIVDIRGGFKAWRKDVDPDFPDY
ncbi:molybdopterin biosynthesis protein moeB [Phyllosticta citribraziliensis]